MAQRWTNNAISTLSAGISAVDTTIFVQPGHGGRYPTIVAPDFCYCTLEDASGNIEIVKVTAHAAAAAAFTVVVIGIIVVGTLWVMHNMNVHMMH